MENQHKFSLLLWTDAVVESLSVVQYL